MSLSFGHDDLELNPIHDIKPLVAPPYYTQIVNEYRFFYRDISLNVLRGPIAEKKFWPRVDIIAQDWIEEKNTQLVLLAHTFDEDTHIPTLAIKYELKCIMKDFTVVRPIMKEFDLMPFKKNPTGKVEHLHNFVFENKKYYISEIQPDFKNIFKMNVEITTTNRSPPTFGNESMLQIEI